MLVRLDPLETTAADGLLNLPYEAQDRPTTGTVLAAGPGYVDDQGRWIPTTLRPGDRVVVTIRPGHDLTIDGAAHVMVREHSSPRRFPGEGVLAVQESAA